MQLCVYLIRQWFICFLSNYQFIMIKFVIADERGREESVLWTKVGQRDGEGFTQRNATEPIPL